MPGSDLRITQTLQGPNLPAPSDYGCQPWQISSPATYSSCPAISAPIKQLLAGKIKLLNPGDKKQQNFQKTVESTIEKAIKADREVNYYIRTVLAYLPDFQIRIADTIPRDNVGAEYRICLRVLMLPVKGTSIPLIEVLRHEMRHAFLHYTHLVGEKKATLSAQCFDETDSEQRAQYETALNDDLVHIENLTKIMKNKSLITTQRKKQFEEISKKYSTGKYQSTYPLSPQLEYATNLSPGTKFDLIPNNPLNLIPGSAIVKRSVYDTGTQVYTIFYNHENNVVADALDLIKQINESDVAAYPEHNRLFERDAFLWQNLPSFMINYFFPSTTKFLKKFTDHRLHKPPSAAWPPAKFSNTDDRRASGEFGTQLYIDRLFDKNSIDTMLMTLNERLSESETVYALKYILSKPNADVRFKPLLARALEIKYKNAGVLGYFTGANSILLEETCKAYFHAYKAGSLSTVDYIRCLPLLYKAQDTHYKVMRQKALSEAQWSLQNTHPFNYTRIENLQRQILVLNTMPKY